MKQVKYICDVCGKRLFREDRHWFRPRIKQSFVDFPDVRMDVCSRCWSKFKAWKQENEQNL